MPRCVFRCCVLMCLVTCCLVIVDTWFRFVVCCVDSVLFCPCLFVVLKFDDEQNKIDQALGGREMGNISWI